MPVNSPQVFRPRVLARFYVTVFINGFFCDLFLEDYFTALTAGTVAKFKTQDWKHFYILSSQDKFTR